MDFKRQHTHPLASKMPKRLQKKLDGRVISPGRLNSRAKLQEAGERRQQILQSKSQRVVAHNKRVLAVQQKAEVGAQLRARKLKRKSEARIKEANRRRQQMVQETIGKVAANNKAAMTHARVQAQIDAAAQQNILLKHVYSHIEATDRQHRAVEKKRQTAARRYKRVQERRQMQHAMDESVKTYNKNALENKLKRAEQRRAMINQPIFSEENNARAEKALDRRQSPTSTPTSRTSSGSNDISPQMEMMQRAHRAGKELRDRIIQEMQTIKHAPDPVQPSESGEPRELVVVGKAAPIYDAAVYDYQLEVEDTDSDDETDEEEIESVSSDDDKVLAWAHQASQLGKELLLFATSASFVSALID